VVSCSREVEIRQAACEGIGSARRTVGVTNKQVPGQRHRGAPTGLAANASHVSHCGEAALAAIAATAHIPTT